MIKYLIFTFFMILSFSLYQTSHDYSQYYIHYTDSALGNFNNGIYSSYYPLIIFFINYIKTPESFVLLLWTINWISVFYFLIYRNNFNNLFLLSYFIIYSYLWHSNQLRQGIIMPIILHLYYNREKFSNKTIFFYSLFLSTWHLAAIIILSFLRKTVDYNKNFLLFIPLLLFVSLIFGGKISLINITSILVMILFLFSYNFNLKSIKFPFLFFVFFLLFRSIGNGVIGSRMLELSCLTLPMILFETKEKFLKFTTILFSVIITYNNFLFK